MRRKIIMYVFGDITTDARVQRAANALASDFEVVLLSQDCGKTVTNSSYTNILLKGWKGHSLLNTLGTIFKAYRFIKREHPYFVYAHDFYSTILCRLLISKKYCNRIIYDAHELIIPEKGEKTSLSQKFYYHFERRIVKRVDLLICASEERGVIMQNHYQLSNNPLVIKNISQLSLSDDSSTKGIIDSLKDFFLKPGITVVYAGAVTRSRHIDKLLNAVVSLMPNFKLLIVGNGDALSDLQSMASRYPNLNYAFTGSVSYKSLGAILTHCDIGFLYYPTNSLNNIYCASNKIYEYASVGLPMMANENPTVKKILEEAHIGLSTNDFKYGLHQIELNSRLFKDNCLQFTQNNNWITEAEKLVERIALL